MIDLHLHLDGSLEPEFLYKLAIKEKLNTTLEEIKDKCICKADCTSLNDYLTCFDLPLTLLQTEENLMLATANLLDRLERENMLYAEIRFAPQLHTKKGLPQEKVVSSVLSVINSSTRKVKANLILCCMRGPQKDKAKNIKTIEVASNFIGKGVVAIDLAGAESLYKTKDFENLFKLAKMLNVPFVIHAGESDDVSSVRSAVKFGASRIGHGIRLQDDPKLMKLVKEKQIAIEMCPSSNLQTKAIKSIKEFPIKKYLDSNILCTINTDNMTVSSTTINNELAILNKNLVLTKEEIKQVLLNAVRASFLNNADKTKLMNKVLLRLNN